MEKRLAKNQCAYRQLGVHSSCLAKFSIRQFEQDLVNFLISLLFDFFVLFDIHSVIKHFLHDAGLEIFSTSLSVCRQVYPTFVISMLISRIAWLI